MKRTLLQKTQTRNFNKYRIEGMLATCKSLKVNGCMTIKESNELNQAMHHISLIIKHWKEQTKCLKK